MNQDPYTCPKCGGKLQVWDVVERVRPVDPRTGRIGGPATADSRRVLMCSSGSCGQTYEWPQFPSKRPMRNQKPAQLARAPKEVATRVAPSA